MLTDETPSLDVDTVVLAVLDPRDRLIFPILGIILAQTSPSADPAPGPGASRRLGAIASYTVRPGDTLASIAARFGVNAEWVRLANRLSPNGLLQTGQPLLVPTLNGPIHVVQPGETLSEIAASYRVDLETVTSANELENERLITPGQRLLVPGGTLPAQATRVPVPTSAPIAAASAPTSRPAAAPAASVPTAATLAKPQPAQPTPAPTARPAPLPLPFGSLVWPVVGAVTQRFGENGHSGLDIAAPVGTPVRAAGPGTVVVAAKLNHGYGWRIVIDHGDGYTSLYAHLSSFSVAERAHVARGQVIGQVGATGVATGPHLHFELAINGRATDPMRYLP
jgi:murein DD-endopeptidase MepM/ murein hydrolase activator NlpD